ncbi:MAG: BatD family protein [Akkermansia sp.]|nr:BatD family protein [Akkermansia sp.]
MRHIITLLGALLLACTGRLAAEIIPIWSTGVAVPGEKVLLYLVDTQSGSDVFMLTEQPRVKSATVRVLQPKAGANPLDPNRAMVEVLPILITPDMAGQIEVEDITATYNSGKKETVKIPPLPVRPTSDIKWYNDPVVYGALWYTDIKDGYVYQPVKASLKLFMRGDCNMPYPPLLNAVGVKAGNFSRSVQGVVELVQGQIMPETAAFARGQNWRTADFKGEFTPYREGNSDVVGKIMMVRAQGFFGATQEEVVLPTVTIGALPLPPGAPANFADTVGQYSISATSNAKELAMNEAVEVEITVRGTGNLQQLDCPAPQDAEDWKLIPATSKPIFNTTGETIGMVFTQLLRPTAEVSGIPSFSFSYFDPASQEYKTAASAPIPLPWKETDAAGSGLRTVAAEPPPAGEIPVEEMTDIYSCIPQAEASRIVQLPRWLWYLLYAPAIGILLALLIRSIRNRVAAGAADRARDRELARMEQITSDIDFLKAIGAFVESRIPASAMTPELQDILTRRDNEAFRPGASTTLAEGEKETMLRRVRKALAGLGSAAILVFCCLLGATSLQANEPTAPATGDAVAAYEAGQFSKALQMFQEEAGVHNEAVRLYNIGNCEYRLGNPGKAALYYARALLVDPGFREAEANLGFIQRKEGALLPTRSGMDVVFTFLSCSKLWVLTIMSTAALALCIALQVAWRQKRRLGWLHSLTVLSALLSLLCATNWIYYLGQQKPDITALSPHDTAYILTATTARNAADEAGSSIIQLNPATPVRILAHRASWCYIETATGVRGWIPTATAEALEPGGQPQMPILLRF